MFLTPTIVHLCEAQLLASQVEEAASNAKQALALARTHGQRSQEAWAQRILGEAAAISDPPNLKAAEGAYQEAMTCYERALWFLENNIWLPSFMNLHKIAFSRAKLINNEKDKVCFCISAQQSPE